MQLSLPSRKCPRCRAWREPEAFAGEVSLCLVCYSRVPGNEGLTLSQLREKAATSPRGSRRRARAERRKVEDLLEMEVALKEEEVVECRECRAFFSTSDLEGGKCGECRGSV